MRKFVFSWVVLCMSWGAPAFAQDAYPSKAVRIIVGYAAGGGNDVIARLVGQKLAESLGQPVLIENRPGAGSIIAAEFVAKAPPDGYTLLLGASGPISINPAVYSRLSYSPLRDFVPVSMISSFPLVLIVNAALPVRSVAELVAHAKANPAKANYGASSASFQLVMELFKTKTGAPLQYIPYKGTNESVNAVISGDSMATFADTGPVSGLLKGGKIRGLAVTAPRRIAAFPELPTMAETGFAGMDAALWNGLLAPAGTPGAVVKRLQDEVIRIVQLPDVRERMNVLAVDAVGNTSEEFARIIAAEIAQWSAVAKAANIRIEQ